MMNDLKNWTGNTRFRISFLHRKCILQYEFSERTTYMIGMYIEHRTVYKWVDAKPEWLLEHERYF